MMDAKENALRLIRFDHPERVISSLPAYHLAYYGCDHEGYAGGGHDCPVGTHWHDIWGTGWYKEMDGVMGFPREHPLAAPSDLRHYRWPDPNDERLVGQIYRLAAASPGGPQFLTGRHRDTLWEKAYMLVGMENLMVYFHTEPGFVADVLHHVMDFQLGMARHYLQAGVEMVALGDDLGMQRGPLFSPRLVDQFLIPEYQRLFGLYKSRGVLIGLHSCGCIEWALPRFMALGVDILNPIQATANDLERVRTITQGRMALQGGVSTATVMDGPVEAITAEVRTRLWQLGREGGYICCPDQGLPFPRTHVAALSDAVATYGVYPLRPPDP